MVALAHIPQNAAWSPNPGPQTEFLACGYREVLFGGAAGGGKSDGLLGAAIRYVDCPEHNAIIFRRSYPELRNLIKRSLEVYPLIGGAYNRSAHEWRFPSGATLIFRFIDSEEDVYAYQGDSFTAIGWDELTQFPGDFTDEESGETYNSAYVYMLSRLRKPAWSKIRLMVRSTCNPGGVGHHWVKARFKIDDAGNRSVAVDPKTGLHRAFIPSRIKDNPFLAGGEYEHTLDALPLDKRKALKEGRWDIFAGAQFSEWNPRVHVVEPFPIPNHWERWRGGDDGYNAPACSLWMARNPLTRQIVVYRELYRTHMTAPNFAERVKEGDRQQVECDSPLKQNGEYQLPDETLEGVLDSAAFSSNGQSEISRGDQMNNDGCGWVPAEKGPGSRRLRVKKLHDLLAPMPSDPEKRPGIVFLKGCAPNAVRTIPALPKDAGDPDDVDTDAEDHPFDALTYGLQHRRSTVQRVRISGF